MKFSLFLFLWTQIFLAYSIDPEKESPVHVINSMSIWYYQLLPVKRVLNAPEHIDGIEYRTFHANPIVTAVTDVRAAGVASRRLLPAPCDNLADRKITVHGDSA
jgi:hypothetical protein